MPLDVRKLRFSDRHSQKYRAATPPLRLSRSGRHSRKDLFIESLGKAEETVPKHFRAMPFRTAVMGSASPKQSFSNALRLCLTLCRPLKRAPEGWGAVPAG